MTAVLMLMLGLAVFALGCGGIAGALWMRDMERRLRKLEDRWQ